MQHGSLLTVLASCFPEIVNLDIELPAGEDWALISDKPVDCYKCSGRATYAIRINNFEPMTGLVAYCSTESRIFKGINFSHLKITELEAQARSFLDKNNIVDSKKVTLQDVRASKVSKPVLGVPSVTTMKIEVPSLIAAVPVPDGYKSVAWLRIHEAQAIAKAYKMEKDTAVETTSGKIVFNAQYFGPTSKEAKKFYANVQATRFKSLGQEKIVGWIREEEANAVVQANQSASDIVFEHINFGRGGLVQYFDPDSLQAKTFRSTARLLRKK